MVNHLSDSVSVVAVNGVPRVTRTLLVGDEPRDIVFAGSAQRAFITTAHRGQHRTHPSLALVPGAGDPQLTSPGVGRADVWVFDPNALGLSVGGTPLRIMTFFADTPRALAVSPDRNTVYVAAFKSGNQTTVVAPDYICPDFATTPCVREGVTVPGGLPGPATNYEGKRAPDVGLIVIDEEHPRLNQRIVVHQRGARGHVRHRACASRPRARSRPPLAVRRRVRSCRRTVPGEPWFRVRNTFSTA